MPITKGPRIPTVEERFWSKTTMSVEDSERCWLWTAKSDASGPWPSGIRYGRFFFRGKLDRAHRVAWVITNGEIPAGLRVLHTCDNGLCVNPAHLWLGTHADNMRDMVAKGRIGNRMRGEKNRYAVLTARRVKAIRRLAEHGAPIRTLAIALGMNEDTVTKIVRRQSWRHVH